MTSLEKLHQKFTDWSYRFLEGSRALLNKLERGALRKIDTYLQNRIKRAKRIQISINCRQHIHEWDWAYEGRVHKCKHCDYVEYKSCLYRDTTYKPMAFDDFKRVTDLVTSHFKARRAS